MNKRNLALLISKHPLLRKLTEDKTIPNSVVASLIVEELMEVQTKLLKSALAGIRRDFSENKQDKYINLETKQVVYPYGKLSELEEEEQVKYKNAVNKKVQAFLAQQNPETKAHGEKLEKQIDTAIDKEINTPQAPQMNAQELIPAIADVIIDMGKQDQFVKTYNQNAPAAVDFILTKTPEEQVDVLKTAPPEAQKKVVKAVAAELEKDQQENPFKELQGYSELKLKPPEEKVFIKFMTFLKEKELLKELSLRPLFTIIGRDKGMSEFVKSLPKGEKTIWQQVFGREDIQEFLKVNLKQMEKPQEPGKEEKPSTTDPEKFDVDPELLSSLITASETFIDEFYEKAFLKDQGVLLTSVLTVLATIVEKEELEKAAKRTSKSTEKPEETEETETLAEQEEQPTQDPVKLRNIQVDLKSFIKLVKRSKDILKAFDEFRAKGKVVGSSYKEKFMNILKQLQKNIKALVRDISSLNLISEKKDVSETENKWSAIEKGYNEASRSLSNIIAAGADDIESFDMEKNVNDAYTSLMSISGFFPSVNPFGAKTTKFNEYNELYTAAVKNVKSTIRDALELAKGKGGSNTANNTIESLKEFSGQIQSIFGIPSEFEDVQVKPNEPAAEGEPDAQPAQEPETKPSSEPDAQPAQEPETKPSDGETPPEVEVEETFTEEIQEAMSQIEKILPITKFTKYTDEKYYNTFIKLILIMYSKDQLSEEIRIGSISAPLAAAAPNSGMFNQQTLQEKLKSLLKNNNRLVSTISSMTRDIDTNSMKILLGIIAANKSKIVPLDFDAILSKDFILPDPEKEEDTPEELEYDNLPDEVKPETPGESTYETIMNSKVPESLGFSAFPEEEEVLKLFKWYQATNKPISEKLGQTISNRISEKHPKLQTMITSFIDDFLKEYHPQKIKIWSEIMSRTSAMDKKQSVAFVNYLLNPIDSKHNLTQKNKKANKEGYVRLNRKLTEQVLANKLKPLIREMLTKGK